jgi:hypothetical protein
MDNVFVVVGGAVTEPWSIQTTLSACISSMLKHYEQETAAKHDGINISRFLLAVPIAFECCK